MARSTSLAKDQLRALARLKAGAAARDFYLAGGTAVAFHLAHRRSLDLDLFSLTPEVDLDAFRSAARSGDAAIEVIAATDVALQLRVEGVPVDVVRYPYPLLEPPDRGPEDFPVAGLLDLATMKMAAIAKRGIRRDFWDLYEIARSGIEIRSAGDAYRRRFGLAESDLYHVWRSLTYFADADRDPVFPAGLSHEGWQEIARWFQDIAAGLIMPDAPHD